MNMKYYYLRLINTVFSLVLLIFLLISCGRNEKTEFNKQNQKPNIILILADDLGYSDIGCYGAEIIQTPHLTKLAQNGLKFTQFYNTARCCPSRASILTGLHPHQTGLGAMVSNPTNAPGYQGEIGQNCVTIAEVLNKVGYRNYMTGKWHVAHSWDGSDKHNWPLQRGFDRYFGTIFGAGSYFDPRLLVQNNDTFSKVPANFYYTDAIADSSISMLKEHLHSYQEQPFFLYLAFTAPHWPLHAKESDISKYRGKFNRGWDELRKLKVENMKKLGIVNPEWEMFNSTPGVPAWEDVTKKEWELNRMEVYAAMIDCMDQGIGRILEFMEETNQLENTLILFLSDNGACAEAWGPENPWASRFGPKKTKNGKVIDYSNDGSRMAGPADTYYSYGRSWAHYSNTPLKNYKTGTNEGGISSPFIVHWPDKIKEKAAIRNQMCGIIDIMPTLVEIADATYPETFNNNSILPMQGKSLKAVFLNNTKLQPRDYFVEHIGQRGMIHHDTLKLVKYGKHSWQLYDLKNDRTETLNLEPVMSAKTKELAERWEKWAWEANVLPKPDR